MKLDEAIKHCEEKAKELFCKADEDYYFDGDWGKRIDCLECAREHEQLSRWLKNYKRIKELAFSSSNETTLLMIRDILNGEEEE